MTRTVNNGFVYPLNASGGYGPLLEAISPNFDSLAALASAAVKSHEYPSTTLNVDVSAGTYRRADGSTATYAGAASFLLTDNATNYVYLTDAGTLTAGTSAPSGANVVTLAKVTTLSGLVVTVADARVALASSGRAGLIFPPTLITAATATLTASEGYVQVNRAGAVTLTLPAASTVQVNAVLVIHDISGAAGANNITINSAGADTVNGGTSAVISANYGGYWLWCDGISKYFNLP